MNEEHDFRKIVQIAVCGVNNTSQTQCDGFIYALCDDGTLWMKSITSSNWEKEPPIDAKD